MDGYNPIKILKISEKYIVLNIFALQICRMVYCIVIKHKLIYANNFKLYIKVTGIMIGTSINSSGCQLI